MNKADLLKLAKDPRRALAVAASEKLIAGLAEAKRIEAEARATFEAATAGFDGSIVNQHGQIVDEWLFDALRPRGDGCRLMSGRIGEAKLVGTFEIVNVTEKRVILYGAEYKVSNGYGSLRAQEGYIHTDDLARIKAGELKGWRQKPWPKAGT